MAVRLLAIWLVVWAALGGLAALANDDWPTCTSESGGASLNQEFVVCTAPGDQRNPATADGTVVWQDGRTLATTGWDIYGYSLTTGQEFPICTGPGDQLSPAICDNIVVWADSRNIATTGWDIYGYNLTTGQEFPICTAAGDQVSPAIWDNIVVWQDSRNGHWHIYGYDLQSRTEFPICTRAGDQERPRVADGKIVWQDSRNFPVTGWDIYAYDMVTGQEFPICTAWGDQLEPDICGPVIGTSVTVLWTDMRNDPGDGSNSDIYGKFWNSYEFSLCTQSGRQTQPAFGRTTAAWTDERNAPGDDSAAVIYAADLCGWHEFPDNSAAARQESPALPPDGSMVIFYLVWADGRNAASTGRDIYGLLIHDAYVQADVDRPTVENGAQVQLWGYAWHTPDHGITYSWHDGGAGGTFNPSGPFWAPVYTPPPNLGDTDREISLTVTATCLGNAGTPPFLSVSASTIVTVKSAHKVTITATANPPIVSSAGTLNLTALADDNFGHAVNFWTWSDGGAGGSFSPSPYVQNPVYTAPANAGGGNLTVNLTVAASCAGPQSLTGSALLEVKVVPAGHAVGVLGSANPTDIPSSGTSDLAAAFYDTFGHSVASWFWTDWGAGGSFSPSATVPNPTYHAPANRTDSEHLGALTVIGTCDGPAPAGDSGTVPIVVQPVPHTLSVSATASPSTVASGGSTSLTASATDSRGHSMTTWFWSDGGAGGSFSPSANVQNPSYAAPANATASSRTITLTVTAACNGPVPISKSRSTTLTVQGVPPSGLTATAVSNTQINLSWKDNSTGETGFAIERAPTSGGTWVQIACVPADRTTYQNIGLTANTTYYYRVRAYKAGVGYSAYSNVALAHTYLLAAPTNLAATAVSDTRINLSWTQTTIGETGFAIERAPASGGIWVQIKTVGANVVTYANTALTANTTYYYRVRAYKAGVGFSAYSNQAWAKTLP